MTDYDDTDIDTNEVTDIEDEGPKGLRRAASKSKKLEAELEQTKRENAFLKAGIAMDDPRMKYFVKGYEGDLTADAVRTAALEAGFIQQGNNAQLAETAASQQRVISASAGSVMEDNTESAAMARLQSAMEEGGIEAMLEVARQYGLPTSTEM